MLTGTALADALWEAGLAPQGTTKLAHQDGPSYYLPGLTGARWRPWASMDHVWHLVLRWNMTLWVRAMAPDIVCHYGTLITAHKDREPAHSDADIPAAIGRLALRLAARICPGCNAAPCACGPAARRLQSAR